MLFLLCNWLEVGVAVLAQRADDVLRQGVTLVDPAADLAHEAFLSGGFRLGLYIVLIIGVAHGLVAAEDSCLGNGADEHTVGAKIHILLHLQAHKGVDMLGQEAQTIVGAERRHTGKLVGCAAALKAEVLEDRERRSHI